jgi:alpha-L-fucosidase
MGRVPRPGTFIWIQSRGREAETIAADELIYLLVEIVSKNGNLLLDVGPEDDGMIPPVQMKRLQALGTWLGQNGEAIYGTHPWKTAEGTTSEGVRLRFTQTDSAVYATMLGKPKTDSITLKSLAPKAGTLIYLLGEAKPLAWSQQGADTKITLPQTLPGQYAYVLRIAGPVSIASSDSGSSDTRRR